MVTLIDLTSLLGARHTVIQAPRNTSIHDAGLVHHVSAEEPFPIDRSSIGRIIACGGSIACQRHVGGDQRFLNAWSQIVDGVAKC